MNSFISSLNGAITSVFGWIVSAASVFGPSGALIIISVVAGVLLVLFYGRVSNQQAIKEAKRGIFAGLLEAIVFRQDLKVCIAAQAQMFKSCIAYFACALRPIVIMAVPCILLLAQLNLFFGARPLKPGEPLMVSLSLKDSAATANLAVSGNQELQIKGPVRSPATKEAFLEVKGQSAGEHQLRLEVPGGEPILAPVVVSDSQTVVPTHVASDFWSALFYPVKDSVKIGTSPVSEMSFSYPEAQYNIFGWHTSWLIAFCVVSLVAGIIGSKLFKVSI